MNKKISLIPILMVIATQSFADIAVNAVNPSCTEPTIGATINEANLQAEWTANTINIEWYDGDTKITPNNPGANTCTYDDEIVVPTNTMTKEGYTFTGWKVRARAAAPVVYTSCSEITDETICDQYSDNGCFWDSWSENGTCLQVECTLAPSESWCDGSERSGMCIWCNGDENSYSFFQKRYCGASVGCVTFGGGSN